MQLVFVCSGNTCRSPLAFVAWRAAVAQLPPGEGAKRLARVGVASAGLQAVNGTPATKGAIAVAKTWGQDLSLHRARNLNPQILAATTHFVTMTAEQSAALHYGYSVPMERTRLLGQCLGAAPGPASEILDPFGGSIEAYETCGEHIRQSVAALVHEFVAQWEAS